MAGKSTASDAPPRNREAPPALSLTGVQGSYPVALGLARRVALRDVELALEQGRSLGLVGPNGSGKSTLLRLLAGVDRPAAGRVEVLGGSPRDRKVRARLGFLPEDSPFPRELRARAVLELLGTLRGVERAEARRRAGELLERVGLAGNARQPLARFSRGMLRRFGLAQVEIHRPDLLLLDEPTAGLDAAGFEVLDQLLRGARERGATLVIASHVLADIERHCEHIAVLLGGRVAAAGRTAELLAVEGRARIDVEGLDAEELEALERELAGRGHRVLDSGAVPCTLLELYRRLGAGERGR